MRVFLRMAFAAAAAFAAAIVAAIALAILNLYLTGHSLGSIDRPLVSVPAWGVHMAMGDVLFLCTSLAGGAAGWIVAGLVFPARPTRP